MFLKSLEQSNGIVRLKMKTMKQTDVSIKLMSK